MLTDFGNLKHNALLLHYKVHPGKADTFFCKFTQNVRLCL